MNRPGETGRMPIRAVGGRLVAVSDLVVSSRSDMDVFNQRGVLLLKAGSPITNAFIQRLHDRDIESVIVKRPPARGPRTSTQAETPPDPQETEASEAPSAPTPITIDPTKGMFAINELVAEKALAPTYSERNARSDERYAFDEAVTIGSLDSDHCFAPICDGWGLDISNQGAGLVTEQPLEMRQRFIMRLTLHTPETHVYTYVKIVRCQPLIGNIHLIGALFAFDDPSG